MAGPGWRRQSGVNLAGFGEMMGGRLREGALTATVPMQFVAHVMPRRGSLTRPYVKAPTRGLQGRRARFQPVHSYQQCNVAHHTERWAPFSEGGLGVNQWPHEVEWSTSNRGSPPLYVELRALLSSSHRASHPGSNSCSSSNHLPRPRWAAMSECYTMLWRFIRTHAPFTHRSCRAILRIQFR